MSTNITPAADPVLEAIESLSDLFRRRLLDDKEKRQAFDALYEQLQHAREQVDGSLMRPLVMDNIRAIDRLDRYSGADREFTRSLRAELLEGLGRTGVRALPLAVDTPFDPSTQEVAEVRNDVDPGPVAMVVSVLRRGYTHDGQVIRPTLVAVSSVEADPDSGLLRPGSDLVDPDH